MVKIKTTTKKLSDVPKKYVRVVLTEDSSSFHRLVETTTGQLEYRLGAGKRKDMTPRKFHTLVRSIVQAAKSHQLEHIALHLGAMGIPKLEEKGDEWFMDTLITNLHLAAYEFTTYKSEPDKDEKQLQEILVCGTMSAAAQRGFTRGMIVGPAVNTARDIANTPALDMTPTDLASAARAAVKGTKTQVNVLNLSELKKLDMGALMAVGQGATEHTPKLIIMEYYGAGKPTKNSTDKKRKPLVLVGKGITYDTGGLNVKPSGAMHDMHMDMSGGSAVIGAMAAISKLKLKKNVIALIPTAENAVSDKAMRAGDIITSMSGKTIEVLHTDAEGRMVLADALTYSERFNPRCIVDVATLTGAALVALGQHTSAVMTKSPKLQQKLMDIGEDSGDYVWPLPLWDEYQQHLKSARADICNIAHNFSRFGGAIEGGAFLANFAPKNVPWAHIDMAPRMESVSSDKLAKGSTGEPVRLLVTFAERI